MCSDVLELQQDLVFIIPFDVCHEIIVSYYLFKLVSVERTIEFEQGWIIAKLLPIIPNDFDNLGAILLTIFLRTHEESIASQITGVDKNGINKSEHSPSQINNHGGTVLTSGQYACHYTQYRHHQHSN